MGNFAVAASEEVIRQGNELLNELSKDGVKKEIALSRLFEMAKENFDGHAMKQGCGCTGIRCSIVQYQDNVFGSCYR